MPPKACVALRLDASSRGGGCTGLVLLDPIGGLLGDFVFNAQELAITPMTDIAAWKATIHGNEIDFFWR